MQRVEAEPLGDFYAAEVEELAQPAAPACSERPTVDDSSPVPVTLNADSAVEFARS